MIGLGLSLTSQRRRAAAGVPAWTPAAAAFADVIWHYQTRTLATGTPSPPSGRTEEIAEAVWEYVPRTLTA